MAGATCTGMRTWLYLVRVYDKIQHHSMSHLGEHNLTPAQFDVLRQLSLAPGITQQALAEHLLVTKGNICGLIDRMETRGLVKRQSDPEDRRSNLLHLTEQGQELATVAIPAYESFIQEHLSVLSGEDQQALQKLLNTLDLALDEH